MQPRYCWIKGLCAASGVLTDPSQVLLGPLQNNGGKVKTMAPMHGFRGIDRRKEPASSISADQPRNGLLFDARDFPRSDDQCDSGAVEGVPFNAIPAGHSTIDRQSNSIR